MTTVEALRGVAEDSLDDTPMTPIGASRLVRLGVRLLAPFLLAPGILLPSGCGTVPSQRSEQSYVDQILELDRSVRKGIEELSDSTHEWTPVQARKAAEQLSQAAEKLRQLTPPRQYVSGHEVLMQFYHLSARSFSLDADILDDQAIGSISSNQEALARLADQLVRLRGQIHRTLPFLDLVDLPADLISRSPRPSD